MSEVDTSTQQRPLLRVVRGNPDDAEVAALTAVVSALASSEPQGSARRSRSLWADPSAQLRRPLHPAPGAWRASALPQ